MMHETTTTLSAAFAESASETELPTLPDLGPTVPMWMWATAIFMVAAAAVALVCIGRMERANGITVRRIIRSNENARAVHRALSAALIGTEAAWIVYILCEDYPYAGRLVTGAWIILAAFYIAEYTAIAKRLRKHAGTIAMDERDRG